MEGKAVPPFPSHTPHVGGGVNYFLVYKTNGLRERGVVGQGHCVGLFHGNLDSKTGFPPSQSITRAHRTVERHEGEKNKASEPKSKEKERRTLHLFLLSNSSVQLLFYFMNKIKAKRKNKTTRRRNSSERRLGEPSKSEHHFFPSLHPLHKEKNF